MDTFLIFFFNGVFLELGDELFCMILAEPTGFGSFQSCHHAAARAIAFGAENRTLLALAGGIMGYAFAPTYYVYVSMNGPPKTAGETFKVLFFVEAFEGVASVIGQLATDGNIETALIPLLFILPIGFAKGVIFAFIFEWRRSELFKFQVVIVLGIVSAIIFHALGGGELLGRSTVISSQPSKTLQRTDPTIPNSGKEEKPIVEEPRIIANRGVCIKNLSSTQISMRMKFFDPETPTSRWRYIDPGTSTAFFFNYPRNNLSTTNGTLRYGLPKPGFGPMETTLQVRAFNGQESCSKVNTYTFRDKGRGVELYAPSVSNGKAGESNKTGTQPPRGRLGVLVQDVTSFEEGARETQKWDHNYGVVIVGVHDGTPAHKAGMVEGDIIYHMNDEYVSDTRELLTIVDGIKAGDTARVSIFRNGNTRSLNVTFVSGRNGKHTSESITSLGITMRQYNNGEVSGVIVESVSSTSDAYKKGLRKGDIITEAGQEPIKSPFEFVSRVKASQASGRQSILLMLRRNDDPRFIAVKTQ